MRCSALVVMAVLAGLVPAAAGERMVVAGLDASHALGRVPAGLPSPRDVPFPRKYSKGSIVVITGYRRLYRVLKPGLAREYVIGVGRDGFGWTGRAVVGGKAEWPDWHPPAEMRERALKQTGRPLPQVVRGGPDNPLGARALYLFSNGRDTLYRIHGTNKPWQLGGKVTSGCFRMLNQHVVEVYATVRKGAPVFVFSSVGDL